MKLPFYKVVRTEEETEEIANLIFEEITSNNIATKIINLNGNLGAGKTTFTKSFCKNFKINNVTSPSFSIVNEYIGTQKIFHFDFYRLKKIEELYDIGFEEYLNDQEAIVIIEWGNLMEEILPKNRLDINIEMINDVDRKIQVKLN